MLQRVPLTNPANILQSLYSPTQQRQRRAYWRLASRMKNRFHGTYMARVEPTGLVQRPGLRIRSRVSYTFEQRRCLAQSSISVFDRHGNCLENYIVKEIIRGWRTEIRVYGV